MSVCAYITGRDLEHSEHHREPCREGEGYASGFFACKEMDPGRYGLQQGWDNNSVIVVSSLISHIWDDNTRNF